MREWELLTSPRRWIRRHSRVLPALYAGLVITGVVLTGLASLVETRFLETRAFQGTVPPLSEGREAVGVPEATYDGLGFGEARAAELECGVAVHFLTDAESRQYQASGTLPPPQLHCQRTTALLPGVVADVRIENQRLNASTWRFELDLFEVSPPRSYLFLPATAFMLVGGIGLAISFFQRALGRWLEGIGK